MIIPKTVRLQSCQFMRLQNMPNNDVSQLYKVERHNSKCKAQNFFLSNWDSWTFIYDKINECARSDLNGNHMVN